MTDWNAKSYRQNSSPQEAHALSLLDKIDFRGNERVLDIGCGDGKITAAIAKRVKIAIGIDPSPHMIEEAKKSFSHLSNLYFERCFFKDFSSNEPFDYIVSFSALQYEKDHLNLLKKAQDLLTNEGMIVFSFASGNNPYFDSVISQDKWAGPAKKREEVWHPQSKEAYEGYLKKTGFSSWQLEEGWAPSSFAKKESFLKWVMAWVPFVTGLASPEAEILASECVEAACKGQSAPFVFSVPLLVVFAKK